MTGRSFKRKMVLLSVFSSGLILAAFGGVFFSALRRLGLDRTDRELLALADAQVRRSRPDWHWREFEQSLALHGAQKNGRFLLRVLDRGGRRLHATAPWPAGLDVSALAPEMGPVPREDHRPPPPWEDDPGSDPPDLFGEPPPPPDHEPRGHGRGPAHDRPSGPEPPPPLPPSMAVSSPRFLTLRDGAGCTWRFIAMDSREVHLALGMDLADVEGEVRRFGALLAVAGPIALLLLSAAGWLLAGRALRPVEVLARTVAGVTARGLDQRVPSASADGEFRALIDVINGMLARLEQSFHQATRFSADAAHELKTPLTVLQGQLQQALQSAPPESAEQRRYAELIEEVQRLKVIVRKLLLLAQADAGQMRLSVERLDLSAEIEGLCEDVRQLAPGLQVEAEVQPGVEVLADRDLLRQALQNLASNAVHHNRADGRIALRLRAQDQGAIFTIENDVEPGLPFHPERLFERFYRGDKARSRRKGEGAGLGLSLAREIVRAHRGDVALGELRDETVTFVLTLPLAGYEGEGGRASVSRGGVGPDAAG